MFFIQTSTLPPRMHWKLRNHGRNCIQNTHFPTKIYTEVEDKFILLLKLGMTSRIITILCHYAGMYVLDSWWVLMLYQSCSIIKISLLSCCPAGNQNDRTLYLIQLCFYPFKELLSLFQWDCSLKPLSWIWKVYHQRSCRRWHLEQTTSRYK